MNTRHPLNHSAMDPVRPWRLTSLVWLAWSAVGTALLLHGPLPAWLSFSNAVFLLLGGLVTSWQLVVQLGRVAGSLSILLLALGGFLVEVLGVHTGFPFGAYRYTGALGLQLWHVPLAIGGAWVLIGGASFLAARELFVSPWAQSIAAPLLGVCLDALLDPVASHVLRDWTWLSGGPWYGIPRQNFIAWMGVLLCMECVLLILGRAASTDRHPAISRGVALRRGQHRRSQLPAVVGPVFLLFGLVGIAHGFYLPVLVAAIPWLGVITAGQLRSLSKQTAGDGRV
ncbi:MAG: carotenoid biosynthesis protein [Alicyclobacillaceae bacterium]|jgi:uncharacterized membrane protein|uniref:carotenoid biosynthesis protein n=1 Tax=Alicyclobacillus sp. SP_1 TaxID=2942475 RepID=UPI00215714D2|nr:carotenoid biosynthesis protein [Alicyclobacillus sp. SP_1]MCY0888649.1 carotenoid biosynthesis protein [Alicyclobacillaceae bacterium]